MAHRLDRSTTSQELTMRRARTAWTALAASITLFLLAYVIGGRDAALVNAAYAEAARHGWPRESLGLVKFSNAGLLRRAICVPAGGVPVSPPKAVWLNRGRR
jgi:hypothetical protein